jgi:hypothetical protein
VAFDSSGWFVIRAATVETARYQFALTAPYYVESPAGPRIDRQSVEFFLAWLDDRQSRLGNSAGCTQDEVDAARAWWNERLDRSRVAE